MAMLKKFDNSYNFSVTLSNKSGNKKKYFVYLDEAIMVECVLKPESANVDTTTAKNHPIHIHKKHGMMVWDVDDKAFVPLIDDFQETYSNWVADRVLLDMPDSTIK